MDAIDSELEKEAEAVADEIIADCRNCTVCASPLDHVRRHLVALYMNASFREHR